MESGSSSRRISVAMSGSRSSLRGRMASWMARTEWGGRSGVIVSGEASSTVPSSRSTLSGGDLRRHQVIERRRLARTHPCARRCCPD